ncbi:unnamed protein product [Brassica oleracea]
MGWLRVEELHPKIHCVPGFVEGGSSAAVSHTRTVQLQGNHYVCDQEIERSATIAPSLTKAIIESRISIVILSQKYASSGWCLDELVEILECKRAMGHKVIVRPDPGL